MTALILICKIDCIDSTEKVVPDVVGHHIKLNSSFQVHGRLNAHFNEEINQTPINLVKLLLLCKPVLHPI